MKRISTFCLICSLLFPPALAQWSIVDVDSLKDGGHFIDNNLQHLSTGYDEPIRAFKIVEKTGPEDGLTFPSITHTDTVLADIGITGFWACYDYTFPAIDRSGDDTLKIEFDLIYDIISGSGEAGRLNVSLMQGVPDGGLTSDPATWGQPTYHFWLFNGSYGPCLSYGGGYSAEENPNPSWNSGAGGYYYNENADDPNSATTYTSTDNYPLVPYAKQFEGGPYATNTVWKHYTWIIAREMQHLYFRDAKDGPEADEEIVFMAIPENTGNISFINEKHGTAATQMPPEYSWYETVDAIRFFNRGAGRSEGDNYHYISNMKITKTGIPVSTYVEFQRPFFRVKEDAGTYQLVVLGNNIEEGDPTTVRVEPVAGNLGHIDNWEGGELVFDSDGAQALDVPLVNTTMEENDTLLLAITEISGGRYPVVGPNGEFQLIIRPAEGGTSVRETYLLKELTLSPNPVRELLRIRDARHLDFEVLQVYDMSGRMVMDRSYHQQEEIDVSGLERGVYFLFLKRENGLAKGKFIRQ